MVVWISGCATTPTIPTTSPTPPEPLLPGQFDGYIKVAVDSIAAPDAASKGKTYLITSAMQNVGDEDLQFQEFARYIEMLYLKEDIYESDNQKLLIFLSVWPTGSEPPKQPLKLL